MWPLCAMLLIWVLILKKQNYFQIVGIIFDRLVFLLHMMHVSDHI